MYCMSATLRPPSLEYARPGANPTLQSIEYVRAILRSAEKPISRNEILRTLSAWSHSMSRQSLNALLSFLAADGTIAEGSKGLIWVPLAPPRLMATISEGRRL